MSSALAFGWRSPLTWLREITQAHPGNEGRLHDATKYQWRFQTCHEATGLRRCDLGISCGEVKEEPKAGEPKAGEPKAGDTSSRGCPKRSAANPWPLPPKWQFLNHYKFDSALRNRDGR